MSVQNNWDGIVQQGRYCGWTFKQAEGAYNRQYEPSLPHTLKNQPKHPFDWDSRIRDVRPEDLT